MVSDWILNWIGEEVISGIDLARKFKAHVKAQEGVTIFDNNLVVGIQEVADGFRLTTKKGNIIETRAVLLAAGANRRKLNVPGEEEFNGKGVAFCSTCDAPLFRDRDVAVVGGGNSGLEAAVDL